MGTGVSRGRIAGCVAVCVGYIVMLVLFASMVTYSEVVCSLAMTGSASCMSGLEKIRYSLYFGKTIDNFQGSDEILAQIASTDDRIENVFMTTTDQVVTYATQEQYEGRQLLPERVQIGLEEMSVESFGDRICVLMPIVTAQRELAGYLGLLYSGEVRRDFITAYLKSVAAATVLCLVFLVTLSLAALHWFESPKRKKRRAYAFPAVMAALLLLSNGVFLLSGMDTAYELKRDYLNRDGETICNMLLVDLNRVVSRGVDIASVAYIDRYVSVITSQYPNLMSVELYDSTGDIRASVVNEEEIPYRQTLTASAVARDNSYFVVTLSDHSYVDYYLFLTATCTGCTLLFTLGIAVFTFLRNRKVHKNKKGVITDERDGNSAG